MMVSSLAGRSLRQKRIGVGSSFSTLFISVEILSAWNGWCPVSSSYITTPSENRSVRLVTSLSLICSGDMYSGEPMTPSGWVTVRSLSVKKAMLKSPTLTSISCVTSRLPGLMSRCTTPLRCA